MTEYFVYIDADYYPTGFVCEADNWQAAYDIAVAKDVLYTQKLPAIVIAPFGGGVIFVGTPDRVQELKERA